MEPLAFDGTPFIGKFIGPNKIAAVEDSGKVTPTGTAILKVTYDGTQIEMIPRIMLEAVASDVGMDYTALFLKKFELFAPTILSLFTDYGLAEFEVEHTLSQLKHSVNQSFNRAISYKWYGSDEQFVEGYDPKRAMTLVEADMILRPIGRDAGATQVHMPVAKKKVDGSGAAPAPAA